MKHHSESKFERSILYVFFALLALELGNIFYINFFHNQNHIGYDASVMMLRAMEMWTQKTLFPVFYEQTILMLDSTVLPASLIYGLTGDIFISFGIVNCLVVIATGTVIYFILREFTDLKLLFIIILLCVVFCNYLSYYGPENPIFYLYPYLWVSCGFYSIKLLYILLSIYVFLSLEKNKSIKLSLWINLAVTVLLGFLTGLSSGIWAFATLLAPLVLYLVFRAIQKQDLKQLFNKVLLFLTVCAGAVLIGFLYCKLIVGYSPKNDLILTGWDKFIQNIYNIYGGYILLFTGMINITTVSALSLDGIGTLICFTLANGFLVSSVWVMKNHGIRYRYTLVNVIMFIVLFNILLYTICHFTYSNSIFEQRYLIFQVFPMLLVFPFALSSITQTFIKHIGLTIIWIFLLAANINGNMSYFSRDISDYNKAIPQAVAKYDAEIVYGINTFINRNLRVLDYSRIYHTLSVSEIGTVGFAHWGDYKYYEEVSEYTGGTLLIVSPSEYETIPANIRAKYVFQENVNDNPNWGLYYSTENWFDETTSLPDKGAVINFPWSWGIYNQGNVDIDDNGWITNGEAGFALYGPYAAIKDGVYNFTLYYEVIDKGVADVPGLFDVFGGGEIFASTPLITGQNTVTLTNVTFNLQCQNWEHRVFANEGAKIRIDKIEITMVGEN